MSPRRATSHFTGATTASPDGAGVEAAGRDGTGASTTAGAVTAGGAEADPAVRRMREERDFADRADFDRARDFDAAARERDFAWAFFRAAARRREDFEDLDDLREDFLADLDAGAFVDPCAVETRTGTGDRPSAVEGAATVATAQARESRRDFIWVWKPCHRAPGIPDQTDDAPRKYPCVGR